MHTSIVLDTGPQAIPEVLKPKTTKVRRLTEQLCTQPLEELVAEPFPRNGSSILFQSGWSSSAIDSKSPAPGLKQRAVAPKTAK